MSTEYGDRATFHPMMGAHALSTPFRFLLVGPLLGSFALVLLGLGVFSTAILGQECTDSTALDFDALTRDYAPVLRFSDQEKYFPTIPFFTAFDGENNNDSSSVDFADDGEIVLNDDGGTQASWKALDEEYSRQVDARLADSRQVDKAPVPVVTYRHRGLNAGERRRFWRFFRGDPQSWERAGVRAVSDALSTESDCPEIEVFEYYFYYVNNRGLKGHEEDIEFVFVFVPLRETRWPFTVTVGAGHDGRHRTTFNSRIATSITPA